jgi:hypothetical protein
MTVRPTARLEALDALKRVVYCCLAGMKDLPDMLEERGATTQGEYREQIVPMLGANARAQRLAFEQDGVLRAELPREVQAGVGVEYLQGLQEGLALLAQDASDPLIPDRDDLARWTADPEFLMWLQRTSGGVPAEVLLWADDAHAQLSPAGVGAARTAAVERALRAELDGLPERYRALVEAHAAPHTRAVAAEAAWGRLVTLARTLRELKGPSCRPAQFGGEDDDDRAGVVRAAFGVLHQVFASLALMVAAGHEPAELLLAPGDVERHVAACAC